MDAESPGDGTDGFSVPDEFSGEFLLVGLHLSGPAEGVVRLAASAGSWQSFG